MKKRSRWIFLKIFLLVVPVSKFLGDVRSVFRAIFSSSILMTLNLKTMFPKSLDELIEQMEDNQNDPGVIEVKLTSPDHFGRDIEEEVNLDGFIVTGSKFKGIVIQE